MVATFGANALAPTLSPASIAILPMEKDMKSEPLCLTDVLALFPEVWPTILMIDAGRYLLFALPAAALIWLLKDLLEGKRIQKRKASNKDRRREILYSVSTSVIFSLNGFFLVFGLKQMDVINITAGSAWHLIAFQSALIILAHDAWFYWLHRAMHWRPLFRAAHLAHHRSMAPTPWAAYAFAPLEALLEAIFLPLFLLVINVDGLTILIFLMHMMARNVVGHSGHEIFPKGWSRLPVLGWITTVTHHDIHHELGRWNYGLYFTFWDRLMGTEHPDYHARFEKAVDRNIKPGEPVRSSLWQG
jgi:lathosterol oxidase